MIIANLMILGRETVIEYSTAAAWGSLGVLREGQGDTHVFLGKVSLVTTNHWYNKKNPIIKRVILLLLFGGYAAATAQALGYDVDPRGLLGPQ